MSAPSLVAGRRRWTLGALALALASFSACFGGPPRGLPASGSTGTPPVYVAVGGGESVGFGARNPLLDAWTQVFYRTALPRRAVFVNLAAGGAGVALALDVQVGLALPLEPALATVWLSQADLLSGTSPADYEARLQALVRQLRRGGRTKVLLADVPDLALAPVIVGRGAAAVTAVQANVVAYNAAVERVARAEGATVVRLHAATAGLLGPPNISQDGINPSTSGHVAVAGLFAAALTEAGGFPS